jgi:drug/metabolite transporter (DMT)-like permease
MGPRPTSPVLSASGPVEAEPVHARGGLGAGVVTALLVQTAISGGTYLVAKRALTEVPVPTLVLWRFLLSGAVFGLLVGVLPGAALPPRRAIAATFLLGFLAGPLNQGLFFAGLQRSTAAHAALLYALTPIGVYLYSVLRGREAPSARAGLGLLLAFAGALVLLLAHGVRALSGVFVGDVLILGAVSAWVVYTAEGKAFIGEHGALRATAWSMIAGALWLVPLAPWVLRPEFVLGASALVKGAILYLALLTSVVSYLLWYWALGRTDASKVAVFSNLQPVATAVAAWGVLGEKIGWEVAVGGVLVLAGVRLTAAARPAR